MPKKQIDLNVKLAPIWKGFFDAKGIRYRVAHGGRGSGKSFTFAIMLVLYALQSKKRILCIRALQKSLRDNHDKEILSFKLPK